ncbi:MAG TPA: FlgD immunoglobulin-like domain containing protein, partial [Myxococcaceae bacterium]|nr:FlgD immunoglobulin-like domain containing protein [Myxococcaceae bacterium]
MKLAAGQSWITRDWALRSLANLTAEIRAARPLGSSAISFRGMATDLHFESYTVAVRPFGSDTEPVVITRRQTPVIDGVLATWTPPGPGLYEAVLTVKDKAGNVTTRSTRAVWSDATAIAELSAEPVFISPNGDGLQDEASVAYRATMPLTTCFSVTDANGLVVRAFDRTHLEPGMYGLAWDGLDDTGAPVADGDYSISAERIGTGLVVDTRSPDARLLPGHQLPRSGQKARLFAFHRATAYDSAGALVEIPSVGAWVSWEVTDLHLSSGQLEALASSGTSVLDRSGSESERTMLLEVERLRGTRLRVRATDQAGNTGLSEELTVPEQLFLVGIGEASTLESGGTLQYGGRSLPRIDKLRPVGNETWVDATGPPIGSSHRLTPSRFAFKPQRYAFALASTIGAPIVSYSVAYPSPVTGAEIIDHENVEMLAEDVLLWDGRALPERPFELKILATDAEGRVFTTVVPFDIGAKVDACVEHTSKEQVKVAIGLARGVPAGEQLAPGAVLEFLPEGGSSQHLSVPIDVAHPIFSQGELSYVARVDSAGLPACRYAVAVRGQRMDGSEVEGSTVLDVCGMLELGSTSNGSELTLHLAETFRQPVRSVDVYLGQGPGVWQYATTLPGFEGTTLAPISSLGCGSKVRLVAHLADGTSVDNLRQGERGFRSCHPTQASACAEIQIAVRQSEAPPLCATQESTYDVAITASTRVNGGWSEFEAMLITPSGVQVAPLALSLLQDSEGTLVGTTTVPTGSLPEGELQVRIEATDAAGNVYRKTAGQEGTLLVDRTPAQLTISTPVPGTQLCAAERLLPDGSTERRFEIRGF